MIGKVLITLATLIYGVAPLFADINATHLLHAEWTPHSRVHLAWLLGTNTAIAVVALWLLWSRNQLALAAVLGLCVMAGFWLALATAPLYGGALTDAGGIEATILGIEANAFSFAVVVALLASGMWAGQRSGRT